MAETRSPLVRQQASEHIQAEGHLLRGEKEHVRKCVLLTGQRSVVAREKEKQKETSEQQQPEEDADVDNNNQ